MGKGNSKRTNDNCEKNVMGQIAIATLKKTGKTVYSCADEWYCRIVKLKGGNI
jgi:hypothetical protein